MKKTYFARRTDPVDVSGAPVFPWYRHWREQPSKVEEIRRLIYQNTVNLTVSSGRTDRECVEEVASGSFKPIPIEALSPELETKVLLRGRVCSGNPGDIFDEIALNHRDMLWWLSSTGLNMAVVTEDAERSSFYNAADRLSPFDKLVGKLYVSKCGDGKLSAQTLGEIAKACDAAGFKLDEELEPSQWETIKRINQNRSKPTFKSFEHASRDPRCARAIRKRLYRARDRYRRLFPSTSPSL